MHVRLCSARLALANRAALPNPSMGFNAYITWKCALLDSSENGACAINRRCKRQLFQKGIGDGVCVTREAPTI